MSFISCSERSRMRTPSQPKRGAASTALDVKIASRTAATRARAMALPSPRELVQQIVERHRQPLEPPLDVELLEKGTPYRGIGNHARGHLIAELGRRLHRLQRFTHLAASPPERLHDLQAALTDRTRERRKRRTVDASLGQRCRNRDAIQRVGRHLAIDADPLLAFQEDVEAAGGKSLTTDDDASSGDGVNGRLAIVRGLVPRLQADDGQSSVAP